MIEKKTILNKNLFKEEKNIILGGIIIFGAILRFYLFNLVKTQAHWWDSLAYGSLAKNMIYHLWDGLPFLVHENVIRPPLFPLIWSWLLRLGASDATVIAFTGIIPSTISIYLVYSIGNEMYNKKVGLVAAVFASVSWIHLFYSARAMTDIPSMCLILASIYFFIKAHNSLKLKEWSLSVLFLALAVLFRYSHAVIALAYVVFLVFVHKTSLLKNKKFWLGGVIGAIPLILFIIINLFSYGSLLPATSEYASSAGEKASFAWYTLGFISYILKSPAVFLFYIGLTLVLGKLVISYGFITKNRETKMHLFNIILLVFVLSFFIFFIKASEDRYLLGLSSIFFIFPALALSYLYRFTAKHGKIAAIVFCIAILLWSTYVQVTFANGLMLDKKESYKQMKDAYEWINYNTPADAVVMGDWGEPYAIFYAHRKVQAMPEGLDFSGFVLEADYIILNAIHQPTPEVIEYVDSLNKQGEFSQAKVFFFDAEQKQPAVIVYQRIN